VVSTGRSQHVHEGLVISALNRFQFFQQRAELFVVQPQFGFCLLFVGLAELEILIGIVMYLETSRLDSIGIKSRRRKRRTTAISSYNE
jgi:hypothetical protein